ncbi:MAG: DUF4442 domain-containing protein [Sphingobacteriales bacterium]|jgi:hypothetical protein|nr:MAG: DUF4442 domain-containing protein [Sphingobacteriales bacterium]
MLSKEQENYRKLMSNPISFKAGLYTKLPMAAIADCRITQLDEECCKVTVPYKFLNKNPFNTTYWAVLGMAAEMAGGALLMMYAHKTQPSMSTFVTACTSKFIKTAKGITTFVCNDGAIIRERVEQELINKKGDSFTTTTTGFDKDGNIIAEFSFEWSIKARKK